MSNTVITAEITFLKPDEGGRSICPGLGYMPHLVVGSDEVVTSDYLGVRLVGVPDQAVLGEPGRYELLLIYDGVDYGALQDGAKFSICEGPNVVGHGHVL